MIAVFIAGCGRGNDDLRLFKGIPTAEIPDKCIQYGNDVCSLFECMVEQCWCFPDGKYGILYEVEGSVESEEVIRTRIYSFRRGYSKPSII